MKNKECDIIKDLLPSYVDNICSEASKEWIEAHLAECEECHKAAEAMKTAEFSAKRLDYSQIDATKKVKKKQIGSSLIILSLCMFAMLVTAGIVAQGNSTVSHLVLYGELPICMVITWFANRGRQAKRSWDKWDTVSLAAAVLAIGYGVGLTAYVMLKLENILENAELLISYVGLNNLGPVLVLNLMGCALVCLVVCVIQMVRMYRKGSINSVIFSVSLLGIFMMLVYCVHFGYLSDAASAVASLKKATFTMLDVGLVGTAVLAFLDWWSSKQK